MAGLSFSRFFRGARPFPPPGLVLIVIAPVLVAPAAPLPAFPVPAPAIPPLAVPVPAVPALAPLVAPVAVPPLAVAAVAPVAAPVPVELPGLGALPGEVALLLAVEALPAPAAPRPAPEPVPPSVVPRQFYPDLLALVDRVVLGLDCTTRVLRGLHLHECEEKLVLLVFHAGRGRVEFPEQVGQVVPLHRCRQVAHVQLVRLGPSVLPVVSLHIHYYSCFNSP
jgi:hypothetical protein